MKIRLGFVSNSSSSSFLCVSCDSVIESYDGEDKYSCASYDHSYCGNCMPITEKEYMENYEIPKDKCPFCTGSNMTSDEIIGYFMKEWGVKSQDELAEKIIRKNKIKKVLKSE